MSNNDLVPKKTSNPAFNPQFLGENAAVLEDGPMTIAGSINKTAICLILAVTAALFTWGLSAQGFSDMNFLFLGISFPLALILGFVIIFKRMSPAIKYMVPIYALAEGALLGAISYSFESMFPGVVSTAVEATLMCVAVMLGLYKFNVIRATEKFRSVVVLSTITACCILLMDLILSLFGIRVPMVASASTGGILFSLAVVVIASLNLILDFDFIEQASQRCFPKHLEWYGAFGLMVTIIWLYLELLRLLAKFQRRN